MPIGKIKFFNTNKGYGFIRERESQEDVFVHITGLIDKVNKDDVVNFDIIEGDNGLMAVNVIIVDSI